MRAAGRTVDLSEVLPLDVRPVPSALHHFATEDGRILSCARAGVLRERRPCSSPRGYLQLIVTREGRMVGHPVHRMVAEAFHGPKPSPLHEVRHLDGDREAHGTTARGERSGMNTKPEARSPGERNGNAILTSAQVASIRRRLAAGELRADIARDLDVNWNVIDRIASGLTWATIAEEDNRRATTDAGAGS